MLPDEKDPAIPNCEERKIIIESQKLMKELKDLFEDSSKDKVSHLKARIVKLFAEEKVHEKAMYTAKSKMNMFQSDVNNLTLQTEAESKKRAILENLSKDLQDRNLELYYENKTLRIMQEKLRKQLQKKIRLQAKEATEMIDKKKATFISYLKENEQYKNWIVEQADQFENKLAQYKIKKNALRNPQTIHNYELSTESIEEYVRLQLESLKSKFEQRKKDVVLYGPKFAILKQQSEEKSRKYNELLEEKKQLESFLNSSDNQHKIVTLKKDYELNLNTKAYFLAIKDELTKSPM
jgi:hypothetical protein